MTTAINQGEPQQLARLLDDRIDPDADPGDGVRLLHMAASMNRSQCVEVLLENGADVHAVTADGQTPLHYACRNPHSVSETIRILVNAGANPLAADQSGETPLDYVISYDPDGELARFLRANCESGEE